jgi:hypothetical protein
MVETAVPTERAAVRSKNSQGLVLGMVLDLGCPMTPLPKAFLTFPPLITVPTLCPILLGFPINI